MQGLRATSLGGHIAVQDAVVAQFGSGIREIRAFGRTRQSRNRFEYHGDAASEATVDDVDDALRVAEGALDKAKTILERGLLGPWRG